PSGKHRGKADRTSTDDRNHVARSDSTVEHTNLIARREDVSQHQEILVAHARRHRVCRSIGEGHANEFCLGTVDHVAEDPAATPKTLPIASFATIAARAARADTRNQHPVSRLDILDRGAHRFDRSDRLVTEDSPVGCGGEITFHDVQVRPANRCRINPDDGVRGGRDLRLRCVLPGHAPRSVVDERLHERVLLNATTGSCCVSTAVMALLRVNCRAHDPVGVWRRSCHSAAADITIAATTAFSRSRMKYALDPVNWTPISTATPTPRARVCTGRQCDSRCADSASPGGTLAPHRGAAGPSRSLDPFVCPETGGGAVVPI